MAAGDDAWERDDWETASEDVDRAEVLRLARHLAEQRERLRSEELAELEELKRTLRERAAQVAARELEVERREAEFEREAAQERVARRGLRFRRERPPVDDDDRAYAEELLARREADVERRAAELTALQATATRANDVLAARGAAIERREQEHVAERARLDELARTLDGRARELDEQIHGAAQAEDLSRQRRALEERARELEQRERALAARAAERVDERDGELARRDAALKTREEQLAAREADVIRAQGALAAREEELRRQERELDDRERLRERAAAVRSVEPYMTFSEGLDALAGRSEPPPWP